jgi:hypothetical protein
MRLESTDPRRGARAFAGAGAVLLTGLLMVPAASASDHNVSLSTEDDAPIERCDQVRVVFGRKNPPRPSARAERSFTLKRSETPTLEMHVPESAGIAAQGWDGADYAVTACLAAAGSSDEQARVALDTIDVAFEGGRLSLRAPQGDDWMVYFLVKVPRDGSLDLSAHNGPIDLYDVAGRVRARTQNGPLALNGCSGEIDVAAENGPVSLRAGGGHQRASVTNGPLAIELSGTRWDGDGVEADATNGPVSLRIPKGYESGVSLKVSGNSPLHCSAGCEGGFTPGGGAHSLFFGSSRPVIHITSGNGPVEVDSGTQSRRSASI